MGYIDFELMGAGSSKSKGSTGGVEAPNTGRSKALARLLYVIGEGPILGLVEQVDSNDGYKSLLVNKVAAHNPDGTSNYEGIKYAMTYGTPDQDPLPGFESVSTEQNVGLRVRADTPVVYRTTASDLDAVNVTLQIPALTQLDKKTGNLNGNSVSIAIDVRSVSDPANQWVMKVPVDFISQKNTATWEKNYRINFDDDETGPWLIRMRRLTPDNDNDSTIANMTYFARCTEILDHKISYANTAMLGIEVDTEQFGGSMPGGEADIYGMLIQYPSNYDPKTRTYNGFWNGTFVTGYCDNPAWVFLKVATDPIYGIGLPMTAMDKWSLYQLAQYCDGWNARGAGLHGVPDGNGGFEPRFEFGGSLNTQQEAYKVLQQIASMMRAIVFYGGGSVIVRQDAPGRPQSNIFTSANIVGHFNYSGTAKRARHNAATVKFRNPSLGYDDDYAVYEDFEAIEKFGYNNINVDGFATFKTSQAWRQAKWTVLTEQLQTDVVTFDSGFNAADILPGDIIEIADPHWAIADFGGRIRPRYADNVIGGDTLVSWGLNGLSLTGEYKQGAIGARNLSGYRATTAQGNCGYTQATIPGTTYTASVFVSRKDHKFVWFGARDALASFLVSNPRVRAKQPNVANAYVENHGEDLVRLVVSFVATSNNTDLLFGVDANVSVVRANTTDITLAAPVNAVVFAGMPQLVVGEDNGMIAAPVLAANKVQLDRDIDFEGTNPQLHLTLLTGPMDDIEGANNEERPIQREVRYFSGNVIGYDPENQIVTLSQPIPDGGSDGITPLVWVFSKDELKPRPFRVVTIKENDGKGTWTISALEYSAAKYLLMDEGFTVETGAENYSNLPTTTVCKPPSALKADFVTQNVGGRIVTNIELRFQPSPDVFLRGYPMQYKKDDDDWRSVELSYTNSFTLEDMPAGNYLFSVRALNKFGITSNAITYGLSLTEQSADGKTPIAAIYTDKGGQTFTDRDIYLFWASRSLSSGAQTAAIYADVVRGNTTALMQDGAQLVVGQGDSGSTLNATVDVTQPATPTITVKGQAVKGDQLIVTIGMSQFIGTAVGNDNGALINSLVTAIDADPRYTATFAGNVIGIGFSNANTSAEDIASHNDPLFSSYKIVISDSITGTVKRTEYVASDQYVYTIANNTDDFGGTPSRAVRVSVSVIDTFGKESLATSTIVSNPAPIAPTVVFDAKPDSLNMLFTPPSDLDYGGVELYLSKTAGFTPDNGNLAYRDRGNPSIPVTAGDTLYARYRFFDGFGMSGVAFSSEVLINIPYVDAGNVIGKDGKPLEQTLEEIVGSIGEDSGAAAQYAQAAQAAQVASETARNESRAARDAAAGQVSIAGDYAEQARVSKELSAAAQQLAVNASNDATDAKVAAQSAQSLAGTQAGLADTARQQSQAARDAAQQAQGLASTSAGLADTARQQAQAATTAANDAKVLAEQKAAESAQSASNASGFATTASGQATIASQKADAAGQSASIADAKATIATTKAGEAGVYAQNAATSENNAAGSASSAASSAVVSASAKDASIASAARKFVSDFNQRDTFWTWIEQGEGLELAFGPGFGLPGLAVGYTVPNNSYRILTNRYPIPSASGRKWQARTSIYTSDPNRPGSYAYFRVREDSGNYIYASEGNFFWNTGSTNVFPVGTFVTQTSKPLFLDVITHANDGNMYVAIHDVFFEDITESDKASGFANASAASAATASASADLSGQRAAAADQSRVDAQTAKSQAEGYRNQAAQSATDAAGSSSTATQQAGVATQAYYDANQAYIDTIGQKDLAVQYANAASGYASTASSSADIAGQRADAASAAQDAAQTAKGQAESARDSAASSRDTAAGSAASAAASQSLTTNARNAVADQFARSHPKTLAPSDREAYYLPPNAAIVGPANAWPQPYITQSEVNTWSGETYVRFKKLIPRIPGRRYRVSTWFFTYATNANYFLALYSSPTESPEDTNEYHGTLTAPMRPPNAQGVASGFFYLTAEFSVDDHPDRAYFDPRHVLITDGGAPNNGVIHCAGLVLEDITSEFAAAGSAAASLSSSQSAASSADLSGQRAAASDSSRALAQTAAGQAEGYRNQAAQSVNDANGASNTATQQAGVATTARNQAEDQAKYAETQAGIAQGNAKYAEGQATAAAGSASTASSQADLSGQRASAAQSAQTAAETARGQAQSYASQASTSRDDAAGSAASAALQAGVSATARDTAVQTAASMLPSNFSQGLTYWSRQWGGAPDRASNFGNSFYASEGVLSWNGGEATSIDVAQRGATGLTPGLRHRITVVWRVINAVNRNSVRGMIFFIGLNGSWQDLGNTPKDIYISNGEPGWGSGNGWATHTFELDDQQLIDAGALQVRALFRYYSENVNEAFQVKSITLEDSSAKAAAIAASQSASSAAASSDQAGQRASAAQTAQTAAETAKGQAETFRNDASQSKTDAAGSASSAATSAGTAASASTAATETVAAQMPSGFGQGNKFWAPSFSGSPSRSTYFENAWSFSTADAFARWNGGREGVVDISNLGATPLVAGHRHRITVRWRILNSSGFNAVNAQIYAIGLDPSWSSNSNILLGTVNISGGQAGWGGNAGWATHILEYSDNDLMVAGQTATRALFRYLPQAASDAFDVQIIEVKDITNEFAAHQFADASSASASSSSASATLSEQKAAAAETSRQQAEGSAGEAFAYRNTTAEYMNNAAGSASTAQTASGLATSARDDTTAMIQKLIPGFEQNGRYWDTDAQGGWEMGHVKGPGFSLNNKDCTFIPKGWLSKTVGRRYRMNVWAFQWMSGSAIPGIQLYWSSRDSNGGNFQYHGTGNDGPDGIRQGNVEGSGWRLFQSEFTITDDQQERFTPRINPYTMAGNGIVIAGFRLEDVTSEWAARGQASAASGSSAAASSSADLAGQRASAADGYRNQAQTAAGQADASRAAAAVSESNAAGSANSASSSATVSASARDASVAAFARTFPSVLDPIGRQAVYYPGNVTGPVGPGAGWPQPYITENLAGTVTGETYVRYKKLMPRIAGRRYRVRAWFFTYATNVIAFLGLFGSNSDDPAYSYAYLGTLSNNGTPTKPPNALGNGSGFFELVGEWEADSHNVAFFDPRIVMNVDNGQPNNHTVHLTGIEITDITERTAAKGFADASQASSASAAASNDAAGQRASAAETARAAASTAQGAAESARDIAVTARNDAQGSANSASSSATLSARSAMEAAQVGSGNLVPKPAFTDQSSGGWYANLGEFGQDFGMPGNAGYPWFARFYSRDNTYYPYGQGIRKRWAGRTIRVRALMYSGETQYEIGAGVFGHRSDNTVAEYVINRMPANTAGWRWITAPSQPQFSDYYEYTFGETSEVVMLNPWLQIANTGGDLGKGIVAYFEITDVTEQVRAQGFATASSQSAASASASSDAAGNSANVARGYRDEANAANGSAQTYASNAQSYATQADASRASAASSAVLSAQSIGQSMLKNGTFSQPGFNYGQIPPAWGGWSADGGSYIGLAPGRQNPFGSSVLQIDRQGQNSGITQQFYYPGKGKYVLEVTVMHEDGSPTSSAVWIDFNNGYGEKLDLGAAYDTAGRTGYQGNGVIRTFTKMYDNPNSAAGTGNLYLMAGWDGITDFVRTLWYRVSFRPATDMEIKTGKIDDLSARVTNNEGALATAMGRLEAYAVKEVTAGGAAAFVSMRAKDDNGNYTSDVGIGASTFSVYNPSSGGWSLAMQISNGNALFTGGIAASSYTLLNNGQKWRFQFAPTTFQRSDNESVTTPNFGALPNVDFGQCPVALNANEVYSPYVENLSLTGFNPRFRIIVPGAPSAQHMDATGSLQGSGPQLQLPLSGRAESANGMYTIGVAVEGSAFWIGGNTQPDDGGAVTVLVDIYALKNGAWTVVAGTSVDVYVELSGSKGTKYGYASISDTFQLGSGVTAIGVSYSGHSGGTGGRVTSLGPVDWQSVGSASTTRSATPSGEKIAVIVRPQ